jgi:hypothetical protein
MVILSFVQAVYYLSYGLWPFVHSKSYFNIAERHQNMHIVIGISITLIFISLFLFYAWFSGQISIRIKILGMTTAFSLCLVDLLLTSKDKISKLYLFDATIQGTIGITWFCSPN